MIVLEQAVAGCEVKVAGLGKAYLVEERFGLTDGKPTSRPPDFPRGFENLAPEFGRRFGQPDSAIQSCLNSHAAPPPSAEDPLVPEDLYFLDIETTGLNNSPLFLIGTMVYENNTFFARQYLARTYGEEPAILSLFQEHALGRKLLVTFNGRSFDYPYIRARAAATNIRLSFTPPHLDLLPASRRIWRGQFPNYKLQTLERHVCGRARFGDIPGHAIPAAYHSFVRTGNAVQMVEILKHNLLDLLTMADLMIRLPGSE